MFEKVEKKRLYWLINQYLSKKISASTFCDEYYYCYGLELDHSSLNDKEAKVFSELADIVNRYSEFEEDFSRGFFNEQELAQKIIETKKHLRKKDLQKTNILFLYPSHPLNRQQVDEQYQKEFALAADAGLSVHHFDIENILHSTIIPALDDNAFIVYRGWMLTKEKYAQLEDRFGDNLLISTENYCEAHYLPSWYNDIKSLTIPSIITNEEDVLEGFKKFPGKAFMKDYVKSLKTSKGSIVTSESDILETLSYMKFYRGILEGGIVLREVVELIPHSETRFFIVDDKIFSPKKDLTQHKLVEDVVLRMVAKNLPFYSVDIATKIDGDEVVVEIGDGQVSDYVGWDLKDFIGILSHLKSHLNTL
jgi:hypothetical protein